LEQRVGPAQNGNTMLGRISGRLSDAYFILDVNKTETLKRAISLIDELFRQLDTRSVNSDIMGDIFEYLLEEVKESGKNGQFRTPRHVIRFMVQLLKPELGSTILDPACGSGGFLLNTLLQWKADNTDKDNLRIEWDGTPHGIFPIWPKGKKLDFNDLFHGYDNDRTMVRIAWMNLILHDLESPEVHQLDALSKRLSKEESGTYDYILANPPFTGSVDEGDLSENRERFPREGKGKGKNATTAITTKPTLRFVAHNAEDQPRLQNLDRMFHLTETWAEHLDDAIGELGNTVSGMLNFAEKPADFDNVRAAVVELAKQRIKERKSGTRALAISESYFYQHIANSRTLLNELLRACM
jgi:type I restriction-modification system DNA methylase subunit